MAATALAACGGGGAGGGGATATPEAAVHPTAPPARTARRTATRTTTGAIRVTLPVVRDTRSAALRHLQAELVWALRSAGSQAGALVLDLDDGQTLFSMRAGVRRPPASVEKLYTSVALLRLLGPNARLHTAVLGTGHLGQGGVWHGNLYLRGDGDPTFGDGWYDQTYEGGQGSSISSLAAQLHRLGVRRVAGNVYGDGTRFDADPGGPATANAPDTPDYGGEMSALVFDHGASSAKLTPPAFAAHELALTLRAQHVFAVAAPHPARTPRGAHQLAVVTSPPLSVLLKLMDVPSDDLFADLLAKQLGYHFLGHGTLAAGASEIATTLAADYGLDPTIHDGSGLDRADRTSPAQIVSLLRQVQGTPTGAALEAALPVTGVSGTVASIGVHTPAQGHCVAKTGTLNNVTNLAGLCQAASGHELAFALLLDGPANWQSYGMLSRMVAAIAGY